MVRDGTGKRAGEARAEEGPGGVRGMRVALVLGTSAGGVGRHVRSIAAGLAERGARVVVCGPPSTQEQFGFEAAGVRFAPVDIADRPRPARDVAATVRLRTLLKEADVVHAHGLRAGGLAVAARARLLPGPLRVGVPGPPLVVTLHNAVLAGGMTGAAYAALERVVARGATMVLGVSPDLEDRMRTLGARSVGHAIVPAPPACGDPGPGARDRIRAELGAGDGPLVVTVGRLADQKGLPTLLDAAAGWAGKTPPVLVAIAGDGPLEPMLRARIEAEGLPVRLLGRRDDVAALLAAADVAVVPSVWEGQPLVVQEILRAGRPLVATRVGGIPGMVGDAALLVPPGNAGALEEAVNRVLGDSVLAVRLGAEAAQRAVALPGERDAVDQLAALYDRLTTSSPRPTA